MQAKQQELAHPTGFEPVTSAFGRTVRCPLNQAFRAFPGDIGQERDKNIKGLCAHSAPGWTLPDGVGCAPGEVGMMVGVYPDQRLLAHR
jgi:hypothetical protein